MDETVKECRYAYACACSSAEKRNKAEETIGGRGVGVLARSKCVSSLLFACLWFSSVCARYCAGTKDQRVDQLHEMLSLTILAVKAWQSGCRCRQNCC